MATQIKRDIGCFTAVFRDGKVAVGDKVLPAGFFFMNALDEYWNPDYEVAARLNAFHRGIWNVSDNLIIGYLDEKEAAVVHHDILYMLNTVSKVKPFVLLNLEEEKRRCDALFGKKSVRRIQQYLDIRAHHTINSDEYWLSHRRPDSAEVQRLTEDKAYFEEYKSTLNFYDNLGHDMSAARDMGHKFIRELAGAKKRDENALITLAMQCVSEGCSERKSVPFVNAVRAGTEYLAVRTSGKNQKQTVGRRMTFERFLDFLIADFFEGLHTGHFPLRCQNCNRYFLQTAAHHRKYCLGIDPKDPKKRSCQAVAAQKGREARERYADHPIKRLCDTRLKTIRTHVALGKITEEQAKTAKRIAQDRRDRALEENQYANTLYPQEMTQEAIYGEAGIVL